MHDFLHNLDWVIPLRSNFLTPVMEFFTALGYMIFFVLALPILYWTWNKSATNRLAVVLLVSAVVNYFLKDWIQDPRPPVEMRVDGHEPSSNGLPSGHTQLAIVFWGWIAHEIGKKWAWIAGGIIAFSIAFSRLYLGVHDVEDVLGGAILGIGGLLLFRWMVTPRFHFWREMRYPVRVGIAAVALTIVLLLWRDGPAPDKAVLMGAFLVGWLAGVGLERRHVDFVKIHRVRTVVAAVFGLVLIYGMAKGLGPLFKATGLGSIPSHAIAGLIMGVFITFCAPWLFTRLRLKKPTISPKLPDA
ncbi:MAG: phosphatase PAP2 family protein [Verrucomicrobiales bacterium]|nr:phosphatase PAP2 family protein [Verrucomicrobiales bacterium]